MAVIHPYESMLILKPMLAKEDTDKLVDKYCDLIRAQGGEVIKVDRLGRRKMTYEMKKNPEGFYVLIEFKAPGNLVAELERQLRLNDDLLKFQTLRMDPVKPMPGKKPAAPAAA